MVSARDITVEGILEEDPPTVNKGQKLSRARTVMEEHHLRTLPVVDGEKFVGMLSYRDVMEKLRSNPSTTAVDTLVHTPPSVEAGQNLIALSILRINSGRKAFVKLDDRGRMEGIIGEREIAGGASEADEVGGVTVEQVMTEDLITIAEDESHEAARKKMMEHGISRLVVMDDEEIRGVITSIDTLKAMVPQQGMQGGSGNRRGSENTAYAGASGDVKGEKEKISSIPVRELMTSAEEIDAEIAETGTSLEEAIRIMQETGALQVLVVDDGEANGIVTLKDVIDFLSSLEEVEGILVELTGPDVPEEKAAIHDKIETKFQGGLGRIIDRPDGLRVHMKTYEKDGERHKYSMNFRLSSELGMVRVNAHGWNLLDVVDEGLDRLADLVKKKKEKQRDQSRGRKQVNEER